jgi:hypothetical protein
MVSRTICLCFLWFTENTFLDEPQAVCVLAVWFSVFSLNSKIQLSPLGESNLFDLILLKKASRKKASMESFYDSRHHAYMDVCMPIDSNPTE